MQLREVYGSHLLRATVELAARSCPGSRLVLLHNIQDQNIASKLGESSPSPPQMFAGLQITLLTPDPPAVTDFSLEVFPARGGERTAFVTRQCNRAKHDPSRHSSLNFRSLVKN